MLAVRVLGSSGSYPRPGGACSGLLVTSSQTRVWLDAGPGTLANLQQTTSLSDIDAIVVSHAHADHWLDLPVAATALEWYEPRDRVPVYSNSHVFGKARELIGQSLVTVFDWRIIGDRSVEQIGDQKWRFALTDHYVPTLAARVDAEGASIAYSSDTGPSFDLDRFPAFDDDRPIDLAILESTFLDRDAHLDTLHLSAAEAGEMATAAGCRRLLLTHQAPSEDRAAHLAVADAIFPGPTALAEAGRLYAAAGD